MSTFKLHSRKLLPPVYQPTTHIVPPSSAAVNSHGPTAPLPFPARDAKVDANVVMVLLVLLCALICSLGLNSILRCVFSCSGLVSYGPRVDANNNTPGGIKKKTLKKFTTVRYSTDDGLEPQSCLNEECAICLSEFITGERVRLLPNCNHGFHVGCIDKWLNSHSSCPTCRQCLSDTCHKPIAPLEHEDFAFMGIVKVGSEYERCN
ncbi:RING-H2 finger protein ATL78-like [Impatiens glandulifera]|uniref:RING-H2 finger protein ATL78-like n=1 Tax=Impatiens glandulifera TaxID=253017 RepID=UPI001FB04B89|nr:RING-H2 finger protein ATL78-like [Impatiens glandulifera]